MASEATPRHRAALGAAIAGLGVALGAFGTHSLRGHLESRDLEIFATGVQYQTLHGLAILALAAAGTALGRPMRVPTALMAAGTAIFSASLYALALGAPKWMGAVAPIGGACLIAAWGLAVWTFFRSEPSNG